MTTKTKTINEFLQMCQGMPANQLGNLIAEYVNESGHSGWEGYSHTDMTGVVAFLRDIITYKTNAPEGQFDKPGFGGTTHFTKVD